MVAVTLCGSGVSGCARCARWGMHSSHAGTQCACVSQHLCFSAQRGVHELDLSGAWSVAGLLAASPGARDGEGCWSRAVGLSRQPHGDHRALALPLPVPVSGFCSAAGNPWLSRRGRNWIWAPPLCFCPRLGSAKPPLCGADVGDVVVCSGGLRRAEMGVSLGATAVAGSRHVSVRGFCLRGTCR